jgi:O-antigen ligase
VISVEAFVATTLIARNLASGRSEIMVAAGLNIGAVIGLVVVAVCLLRIARIRRPIGVGLTLALSLTLAFWYFIGILNFSVDPTLSRELVRSLSILGLALIAVNVPSEAARRRLLSCVLLAAVLPAIIAWTQIARQGVHVRVSSTLAHKNEAAAVFAVALAITLWRWLETRDFRLYLPLAILFAVALLGTQSLGGIAQMFVTLLVYPLLTQNLRTRSVIAVFVGLIFIVVFALSPFGNKRLDQLKTTASYSVASRGQAYTTNSLDWRFYNWSREISAWHQKPYLGYGLGSTASLVNPGGNIPHSDILRLLVETGVIGFLLYGTAVLILWRRLYERARAPTRDASYAALALAILAGLLVHALDNNVSTQTATMYSVAIVIGCALASSSRFRERHR